MDQLTVRVWSPSSIVSLPVLLARHYIVVVLLPRQMSTSSIATGPSYLIPLGAFAPHFPCTIPLLDRDWSIFSGAPTTARNLFDHTLINKLSYRD